MIARRRGRWATLLALAVAALGVIAVPGSDASGHVAHRRVTRGSLPLLHAVLDPSGGRIVDASGRQVVLRGIAVNSLGRYGKATSLRPTAAFHPHDVTVIRRIGWNVVRLVLNWSAIEPSPGRYDASYLDHAARIVRRLGRAGVYTIVDMHQDAWSRSLATRPGETCPPPTTTTLGFDGAPRWATLGYDLPHCQIEQQEGSTAVYASWQAFLTNAAGPGGVGVQTRFVRMWRHVAARFARSTDVAGFDLLNEPLLLGPADNTRAAALYTRTLQAIRSGERSRHGVRHIVMVEPSILFSETGEDTPMPFEHDSDVGFAPHIYTGTFPTTGPPSDSWFTSAHRLATSLGGLPVVDGEWGGRPRSRHPIDAGFYRAYQALLDHHAFSGIFWVYRSSCGDPFEITQHAKQTGGLYDVHCRDDRVVGLRHKLVKLLARPYPRAVAGRVTSFDLHPASGRFRLVYRAAGRHGRTVVVVPHRQYPHGYRAVVHGGRVVSGRSGMLLRIRNRPGATRVTLTLTARITRERSGMSPSR